MLQVQRGMSGRARRKLRSRCGPLLSVIPRVELDIAVVLIDDGLEELQSRLTQRIDACNQRMFRLPCLVWFQDLRLGKQGMDSQSLPFYSIPSIPQHAHYSGPTLTCVCSPREHANPQERMRVGTDRFQSTRDVQVAFQRICCPNTPQTMSVRCATMSECHLEQIERMHQVRVWMVTNVNNGT